MHIHVIHVMQLKCILYVLWYILSEDIDEESRNVADEESNEANEQGNPRGIEPDTAAENSHTHN